MDDLVIGIDFGTTNSCVSLYINKHTQILENREGDRLTPSFVLFSTWDEAVVGKEAKRASHFRLEDGIYAIKQFIGKKFNDSSIETNLKEIPFKVEPNSFNDPIVVIEKDGNTSKLSPEELCALILNKLKMESEEKMGQAINKAVIAVPAYFNTVQRGAILEAARMTDLTVLKLLNEPTAAALSYFFENNSNTTDYALVYDLGGGTFDVSVLKRDSKFIRIICVDGDAELGGDDFDDLIVNYVCEQLIKIFNYDPRNDKHNLKRLRQKCEEAKKTLSFLEQTFLNLDGFVQRQCVQIVIGRKKFEEIADGLFKKTLEIVDRCIKDSGISKDLIKEVILSGGSTRIPKIEKMLSDYFDGKHIKKFINPEECVAEGAALQAAMLSTSCQQKIKQIRLIDVLPLSLGFKNFVGGMRFTIRRNEQIPTSFFDIYQTYANRQKNAHIMIYEGERLEADKNRFLGSFLLGNLRPAPPGQCFYILRMKIDKNGILTVKANEPFKQGVSVRIEHILDDKSYEEVKDAISNAKEKREADAIFMRFADFKNYLIRYCIAVPFNLESKNLIHNYRTIYDKCKKIEYEARELEVGSEDYIKTCIDNLDLECNAIIKKHKFRSMPSRSKLL